MIVAGLVGILLGYGTAAAAIKVKRENELNNFRAEFGLETKPVRLLG